MKSLVAIAAGSILIITLSLLMQLAYIFLAVAYNSLANDYPLLNDISGLLKYLVGAPVFLLIMFSGGYVTAYIARIAIIPHCVFLAFITMGSMMLWSLENAQITVTGVLFFILAIIATTMGGLFYQRENRISEMKE